MLKVFQRNGTVALRCLSQSGSCRYRYRLCNNRSASSTAAADQRGQLLVFPEYTAAEGLFREIKYHQAKLQYNRVLDVVVSVMGLHSAASCAVRRKLAVAMYYSQGDISAINNLLLVDIDPNSQSDPADVVRAAQLLAVCHLQQWQPAKAGALADIAVTRSEEINSEGGGGGDGAAGGVEEAMSLLSPSYTLKGDRHAKCSTRCIEIHA